MGRRGTVADCVFARRCPARREEQAEAMGDTYGGQVIGRALHDGGVEHVFGVYGSISLAIEEANRRGIQMLHFRHEQSAAFAADAYARSLRRPGVCFTSSAPGFTNVVSAIAQAKGALSPVVL